MHSKNIWHRDMKPKNVLLIKDYQNKIIDAKLWDFGLSKQSELHLISKLGTPGYMAP